ncbi:PAS domain S-box protein [soil metagenome]
MANIRDRAATPETRSPIAEVVGSGSLFDLLPDGVMVVDGEGRIIVANLAAMDIFGYSAGELSGAPVDKLLPEPLREIHQSHRARFQEDPKMRPMGVGLELFALRKDGRQFPVEISLSPTWSGGELLVTAIVRDITERKAAELQQERLLHEAQAAWARFEGLLESAPDAVVIVDEDGRITHINRQTERFFGYERGEILGQPVEALIPGRFHSTHVNHRQEYADDPHVRAMGAGLELFGIRKDGSEFPVEISLSPLELDGQLLVTATVRDITDRNAIDREFHQAARTLEERTGELEETNRELESFAYSVSHDLRAPLRGIDGFSQALLEDYGVELDERGRRYLAYVRESAQDMGRLIDDLLSLSRVNRGDLQREEVDLAALARGIGKRLERDVPDREVDWQIEDQLIVHGDRRLLGVLLENLLGNAWKFTAGRERPCIEIGAHDNGDEPVYFVRDNGAGFDMNYVDKLFGPFQRLHSSNEFEGTGIGLATAQRIVHRHGGRIWAEGAVDHGATISFTVLEPKANIQEA